MPWPPSNAPPCLGSHGTFNVAGDGVLMLSQAVRRAGRPELPLPPFVLSALGSTLPQLRGAEMSAEQVSLPHVRTWDRHAADAHDVRVRTAVQHRRGVRRRSPAACVPACVNPVRLEQWERQAQQAVTRGGGPCPTLRSSRSEAKRRPGRGSRTSPSAAARALAAGEGRAEAAPANRPWQSRLDAGGPCCLPG